MFKNLINLFNNKEVKDETYKEMPEVDTNYINTRHQIQPLKFHNIKKPTLFISSVYDLENLIKKSLIMSTKLLNEIISTNSTNNTSLIYYSHAIRYILDDISALSVFVDEINKENLRNIIPKALGCLSELYSCCINIKENYKNNVSNSILVHKALDNIIKLIEPYIKTTDGKIDCEEMYEKISLRINQNMINKEIGKCENLKKINEISYIVNMLLMEDSREIEDVAEIIRKRRLKKLK